MMSDKNLTSVICKSINCVFGAVPSLYFANVKDIKIIHFYLHFDAKKHNNILVCKKILKNLSRINNHMF